MENVRCDLIMSYSRAKGKIKTQEKLLAELMAEIFSH